MRKPAHLLARTRLIALVVIVGALAGINFLCNQDITAQVGNTTAVVGIAKTPTTSPTNEQIDAAVRQAVALAGGIPAFDATKKIVIQPNLVEAGWTPNNGVMTNLQVVKTLVDMCEEAGAVRSNITICEGSAWFHGDKQGYPDRKMTLKSFHDYGLDTIPGVNLVDANDTGASSIYPNYPGYQGGYSTANHYYYYQTTPPASTPATQVPNLWIDRLYAIPKCVAECDYYIRVPCLKNHDTAGITGGLKLAFGLAPADVFHYFDPNAFLGKWNLLHQQSWGLNEVETNARGMVDITLLRPPDLVVLDGLIGISSGPTREPLRRADPYMACIMASTDIVALDAVEALAMGYRVDSIPSLARAAAKGLGTNDPGKIELRGYRLPDIRRWFGTWGCAQPGDRTGPTIGGLSLADGVHVCGQVTVGPTSYFDLTPGVCKGELYVDGYLVDSNDANAAGFKTTWTPAEDSDGVHTLTYILYDKMLNETPVSRTVYVHSGDPVASAYGLENGAGAFMGPVVFMGKAPAIDANTFFVCTPDGTRGMRVRYSSTAPSLLVGQRIGLTGTMATTGGQRYLACTSYVSYESGTAPGPKFMRNESIGGAALNGYTPGVYKARGPYNLGLFVKTYGKVIERGSGYFVITDGSIRSVEDGVDGIEVKCGSVTPPNVGDRVTVSGFSCCEDDGTAIRRVMVVRSAGDIVSQ